MPVKSLELGRISLNEALALTARVAERAGARRSRFAILGFAGWLEEDEKLDHPRPIFSRAIENGDLVVIEMSARAWSAT